VIDVDTMSEKVIEALATGRYAFIDAGCGDGASTSHLVRRFQRTPGLGLDYHLEYVEAARSAGFDAMFCNLLMNDLELPARCVEFAAAADVLEHLPTERDAVTVIRRLAHAAREFLLIRHPSFEDVDYLASLGVRLNWTDWTDHTNMLKLDDFRRIFAELGLTDYVIVPHMLYTDSSHDSVVPLSTPPDTVRYDPEAHGPKPIVAFDRPVWGKFDIFVRLDPAIDDEAWQRITSVDGWEAHWEF
jgi:hypothetical protein